MTNNEIKNIIKLSQKKYREEENKFIIEGKHLINECLKSDYIRKTEKIYVGESFEDNNGTLVIKNFLFNIFSFVSCQRKIIDSVENIFLLCW